MGTCTLYRLGLKSRIAFFITDVNKHFLLKNKLAFVGLGIVGWVSALQRKSLTRLHSTGGQPLTRARAVEGDGSHRAAGEARGGAARKGSCGCIGESWTEQAVVWIACCQEGAPFCDIALTHLWKDGRQTRGHL